MSELLNALKPFADLLEEPETAVLDANGLVTLFVDPDDVLRAKKALDDPRYLFIALKPDSTDYCRGCRMASYSSDFHQQNHLKADELVELWSTYLHKNLNLDCNEAGYDFYIYKDGVQVWNETYSRWDGGERFGYNADEYYVRYDELEKQEQEDLAAINEIHGRAKEKAEQKQQAQKQAEAKKKADEQRAADEKAKEERRKQFEKLQQEFSGDYHPLNPPKMD